MGRTHLILWIANTLAGDYRRVYRVTNSDGLLFSEAALALGYTVEHRDANRMDVRCQGSRSWRWCPRYQLQSTPESDSTWLCSVSVPIPTWHAVTCILLWISGTLGLAAALLFGKAQTTPEGFIPIFFGLAASVSAFIAWLVLSNAPGRATSDLLHEASILASRGLERIVDTKPGLSTGYDLITSSMFICTVLSLSIVFATLLEGMFAVIVVSVIFALAFLSLSFAYLFRDGITNASLSAPSVAAMTPLAVLSSVIWAPALLLSALTRTLDSSRPPVPFVEAVLSRARPETAIAMSLLWLMAGALLFLQHRVSIEVTSHARDRFRRRYAETLSDIQASRIRVRIARQASAVLLSMVSIATFLSLVCATAFVTLAVSGHVNSGERGSTVSMLALGALTMSVTVTWIWVIVLWTRSILASRSKSGTLSHGPVVSKRLRAALPSVANTPIEFSKPGTNEPLLAVVVRGWRRGATIVCDARVMEFLGDQSLSALLAHELAHYQLGHVRRRRRIRWLCHAGLCGDLAVSLFENSWEMELSADRYAVDELGASAKALMSGIGILSGFTATINDSSSGSLHLSGRWVNYFHPTPKERAAALGIGEDS